MSDLSWLTVLFTWSAWLHTLIQTIFPLQSMATALRLAPAYQQDSQVTLIFLELQQYLQNGVIAGNNKAALYHTLACLSHAFGAEGSLFWGSCGQKMTICIALFNTCSDTVEPPDMPSYPDLGKEELETLVSTNMGRHLSTSPLLASASFMGLAIKQNEIILENTTLQLLINLAYRERLSIPGQWSTSKRPTIVDNEVKLQRYRVQPGALTGYQRFMPERTASVSSQTFDLQTNGKGDLDLTGSISVDDDDWIRVDDIDIIV